MAYLSVEKAVVDLVLDALVDLIEKKLKTEVSENDVARAAIIKAGPRQESPQSVNILFHENDPDNPKSWRHRLVPYGPRTRGSQFGNYHLIGGGSQHVRCFTLEFEVWGRFITGLETIERPTVRQIASVVEQRILKAMYEGGRWIGTGTLVQDDYGESVVEGPYFGDSWTDQEEGEALTVRKFMRFWYRTTRSWDAS